MKYGLQMLLLMFTVALLPAATLAQDTDTQDRQSRAAYESMSEEERQAARESMRLKRSQMRERWDAMSPEEREAKRADMRQRRESMTPEEREAMRERRQEMRGKRQSMTPEQREEMRQRHSEGRGHHGQRPGKRNAENTASGS